MYAMNGDPTFEDVLAAAERIRGLVHRTPVMTSTAIDGVVGARLHFKCENLQKVGAFKARGATNAVLSLDEEAAGQLRQLRGECRRDICGSTPRISASDIDDRVLALAQTNARTAGVRIAFRSKDVLELEPDGAPKCMVTNPPYGVRLEKDPAFVSRLAARLTRLHGWRVCLLAGSKDYEKAIPLKPVAKHQVPNGPIDCDVLLYDIP